jgi:gamma-glutamyltranspeptidase
VAERDVPEAAIASIEAAGFTVERVDELDENLGHAQALTLGEGSLMAGSDPRADGSAVLL